MVSHWATKKKGSSYVLRKGFPGGTKQGCFAEFASLVGAFFEAFDEIFSLASKILVRTTEIDDFQIDPLPVGV